jgi:hypothetical protein
MMRKPPLGVNVHAIAAAAIATIGLTSVHGSTINWLDGSGFWDTALN